MSSYFRQQLEDWLKTIDVIADRVGDIGGGANPVYHRVRSWNVKDYVIIDNGLEEMKEKPHITADINEESFWMHKRDGLGMESFDIIFCLEVAEYIYDPMEAFENIYFLLREGGIAYLSFPFLYPHHYPEGHDYLRYTKWGIEKLLEVAGFSRWEIIPRMMKDETIALWDKFVSIDGMHPCKEFREHHITGYLVKAFKDKNEL